MSGMTERFEMRMDEDLLRRLDEWRRQEGGGASKANAIRSIVEDFLSTRGGKNISFTPKERLVILLMCDLLKKTEGETNSGLDPDFISNALYGGHDWALDWEYGCLFNVTPDKPENVKFVADVLNMWWLIELSCKEFTEDQHKKIKDMHLGSLKFPGFDGNNETELMGIANFLVHKMNRFEHFKDRHGFNSHCPVAGRYRRMLDKFALMRPRMLGTPPMTFDEIVDLLSV